MDWDLIEWMMELERSVAAAPSNCDNIHNNFGRMDGGINQDETTGKVGEGLVEEHQIVEVMTDEQVEELQTQINEFHVISESLRRTIASEFLPQHGTRIGNPSFDVLKTSEGHKQSNMKQRWKATPMQKLILENTFHLGKVCPNKEEIKWITSQLSQHGEVVESNVRNWFQNRKTREKRKMETESAYNVRSEVKPVVESSNGKKVRLEKIDSDNIKFLSTDAHFFQTSEVKSEMHVINREFDIAQHMNLSICNSSPYDPSQMPFIEKTQANPSNDYLMGDIQVMTEFGSLNQQISDGSFGFGPEIY